MEIFWAIYFNDGLLNDNDGLLNIKPDANCFFISFLSQLNMCLVWGI